MRNIIKNKSEKIINHIAIIIFLIIVTIPLQFCSRPGVAGVETTNGNTLVAILPNGKPASHARVLILDQNLWAKTVVQENYGKVDSLKTDSAGRFFLKSKYYCNYNIQIDGLNSGQILRDLHCDSIFPSENILDTAKLTAFTTLSGFAFSKTGLAKSLVVAGTDYHAKIDTQTGQFTLENIPNIPLNIFLVVKNSQDTVLSFAKTIHPEPVPLVNESLLVSPGRIVVDDFSHSNIWATTISALTGSGNWYPFSDRDLGGNSMVKISFLPDINTSSQFALQFDANIKKDFNTFYAGFGISFGPRIMGHSTYYNLSKMTSFQFKARADKNREVSILFSISATVLPVPAVPRLNTISDYRPDLYLYGFQKTISVTNQWASYTINPDSLSSSDTTLGASNIWSKMNSKIDRIQFMPSVTTDSASDSLSIWMGDLILQGLNSEDLFR